MEALVGAAVFDGTETRTGVAVLVEAGRIAAVLPREAVPADTPLTDLGGGLLTAGFIDAQVNGGGGVMLNDGPTADAMAAIAAAHRRFGTTGLLPTLITDTPAATAAAIAAAIEAVPTRPGVIGLHLEGPHLAPARRGAHVPALMRPMTEADADQLIAAAEAIGVLMVTVAVEQAPPALIRRLADGGVTVSLGHTDAAYDDVRRAVDAGARAATHLFNAMSPLGHRAPGMAGAALDLGALWCGMIADGHHVHPATLGIAVRAKRGPGRCFLVTDAMGTVGTEGTVFTLNGRTCRRADGRLTLEDGTLAGADIDMAASVRLMMDAVGVERDEALRMASAWPADMLGIGEMRGRVRAGLQADLVHLGATMEVRGTWVAGVRAGGDGGWGPGPGTAEPAWPPSNVIPTDVGIQPTAREGAPVRMMRRTVGPRLSPG